MKNILQIIIEVNWNALVQICVYSQDLLTEDIDTDFTDVLLRKPTE